MSMRLYDRSNDFVEELCHYYRFGWPNYLPKFTDEELKAATSIEVWESELNDPGKDYMDFNLLDKNGKCVATRRWVGY